MQRYKIVTLVDITRSQATRSETDRIKIGQQANFNSLVQAIGLRANITWLSDPLKQTGQLPYPIEGKATFWTWEFETEQDTLFQKDNNPVALLIEDLNGVPIISDLSNDVDIFPAVFSTKSNINTWVLII